MRVKLKNTKGEDWFLEAAVYYRNTDNPKLIITLESRNGNAGQQISLSEEDGLQLAKILNQVYAVSMFSTNKP